MKLEALDKNVEIIQTMSTYPNQEDGLTPEELKGKFDEGSKIIKEYINDNVVPAVNKNAGDVEAAAQIASQGRSAKYAITKPGWKRVLNVIRTSNGMLNLGVGKVVSGGGGISFQALGVLFAGNVDLKTGSIDKTSPKPVIYQLYNHEMGHNNNPAYPDSYARITGVRVGWPGYEDGSALKEADFPNIPAGDTVNHWINTVNCYVDVYVDFKDVKGGDTIGLNFNYAGFADSHNCEAITEETDATDTGIYGEPLVFHEFCPAKDAALYMPDSRIFAERVHGTWGDFKNLDAEQATAGYFSAKTGHIDNMPYEMLAGTEEDPVVLRKLSDGIYYLSGMGKFYASQDVADISEGVYFVRNGTDSSVVLCHHLSSSSVLSKFVITDSKCIRTDYNLGDIANAVRFDPDQVLDAAQQAQARKNIGAIADGDSIGALEIINKLHVDQEADIDFHDNPVKGVAAGEADTDAVNKKQLEDANIALIQKLCPAFTVSGSMVTCQPVEGYPLTVTAEEGATITRCGKNFFGGDAFADAIAARGGTKNAANGIVMFNANNVGDRTIPFFAKFKENTQYTFVFCGRNTNSSFAINHFNMRIKHTDGTAIAFEGTTPGMDECVIVTSHAGKTVEGIFFVMYGGKVELKYDLCGVFEGIVAADSFEAYQRAAFPVGQQIPALPGVNHLWADVGEITVAGRADPVAVIQKLSDTVSALVGV